MKDTIQEIVNDFIYKHDNAKHTKDFWKWLLNKDDYDKKEGALKETWDEINVDATASTQLSWENLKKKASFNDKPSSRISFMRIVKIAAVLFIPLLSVALASLYVNNYRESAAMVECSVPAGANKTITLPDGTVVNINAESFLVYPEKFITDNRIVFLTGEANFDVHKDKKHPFIVKTSQMTVRALGTKFNVNAYAQTGKTITTLEEGSVLVSDILNPNHNITLSPNEQLEMDNRARTFVKNKVDASVVNGWIVGELNLLNSTLSQIIAGVERHYNVTITVDPAFYKSSDKYDFKIKAGDPLNVTMKIISSLTGNMEVVYNDSRNITLKRVDKNREGGQR